MNRLSFLLAGCGFRFTMEDVQTNGRADIVASHVNGVFIFELKVGEPVDKAFRQIREKNYAARSSVINCQLSICCRSDYGIITTHCWI